MNYIIGALVSALFVFYVLLENTLSDNTALEKEIARLEMEKSHRALELATCQGDLDAQNQAVTILAEEYTAGLDEIERIKRKPPHVRYKKIYEIKEIKSNECIDIKHAINVLRTVRGVL